MNENMYVNTLHIYERLKKAKSFDAQAKELAEIFGGIVDDQLATKKDILMLQGDLKNTEIKLKAEIQTVVHQSKSEIIKWVAGMLFAQAGLIAALVKLL